MDDIIQLIAVGLFILFGVLSSTKKKKGSIPPSPKPRLPRPNVGASRAAASRPQTQSVQRRLNDDLFQILKDQLEPPVPDVPDVVPEMVGELPVRSFRPPPVERPGRAVQPLETVEPLDEVSHEEFHEEYVDPDRDDRHFQHAGVRRPIEIPTARSRLRQAVIMAEVLGPPKGLQ